MTVTLLASSFSLFSFILRCFFIAPCHSLSLSLSLSPSLHLDFSCQPVQTEGTWKAEEKIESAPLLTCTFYNLQVRHKEKIEYTGYRNAQEVRVLLLPWSLVCAVVRKVVPCNCSMLYSSSLVLPHPWATGNLKAEGRRESKE